MTDTIAITATTPVTYTPPLSVTIADFNKNPLPLASSATVTFTIIPIPSYPAGTGFSSPSPVSSTISIATSGPSFNIADLANYPGGKVFLRIGSSSIKSSFKIEITGSIGPLALRKKILTVLIN
jgi:hypothetical protein